MAAESVENSSMCHFENDGFCHTLGSAMSHSVHRPPELGRSPLWGLLNSSLWPLNVKDCFVTS